jgi:hypothetical protein
MVTDPDPNVQAMKDLNPVDPPPIPDDGNIHGETSSADGSPGIGGPREGV